MRLAPCDESKLEQVSEIEPALATYVRIRNEQKNCCLDAFIFESRRSRQGSFETRVVNCALCQKLSDIDLQASGQPWHASPWRQGTWKHYLVRSSRIPTTTDIIEKNNDFNENDT